MVQELNNYEEFAQFLNVPIESNTLQDLYNNLIDMALLGNYFNILLKFIIIFIF